jgi:hypothetical protein
MPKLLKLGHLGRQTNANTLMQLSLSKANFIIQQTQMKTKSTVLYQTAKPIHAFVDT